MTDANKTKLIEYLALPKAHRPMTLKDFAAVELRVSEPTVHAWKKRPEVQKAVNTLIQRRFADYIPDVLLSLKNNALAGNVSAARTFLEYVDQGLEDLRNVTERRRWTQKEAEAEIERICEKFYP